MIILQPRMSACTEIIRGTSLMSLSPSCKKSEMCSITYCITETIFYHMCSWAILQMFLKSPSYSNSFQSA
ncbi:hypothetical protein XENTR_v10000667 [Xenopus tropicalis]|nr:hypothetical protein XENTR_v10000667 [Xenopus tropicalis]